MKLRGRARLSRSPPRCLHRLCSAQGLLRHAHTNAAQPSRVHHVHPVWAKEPCGCKSGDACLWRSAAKRMRCSAKQPRIVALSTPTSSVALRGQPFLATVPQPRFQILAQEPGEDSADYNMYSTFLTASPRSVLFSRSNLLKRKDLCFSCLRLGLIRHRRSLRSSHLSSQVCHDSQVQWFLSRGQQRCETWSCADKVTS
jgi:hypothetical protein